MARLPQAPGDSAEIEATAAHEAASASTANRQRRFTVAFGATGTALLAMAAVAGLFVHGHDSPAGLPTTWQIGVAPFALLLLAIAVFPLIGSVAPWWHHNRNKLAASVLASLATLAYVAATSGGDAVAVTAKHALVDDYVPFMTLLLSLFVVTGGIRLEGDLVARPHVTTGFLAVGTLIASFVGTTGASMLLIRPLLATMSDRTKKVHTIVFFIFLVANVGGTLLPIGDPPLFMGYLRGVPFGWTLTLWKEWLFCSVVLLGLHWIIDAVLWRREPVGALLAEPLHRRPLRLTGLANLIYLVVIVLAVAFIAPTKAFPGTDWRPFVGLRELVLLACTGLSLLTTPAGLRRANSFSFFAILEVAAIFLGIFVAMMVPLEVLRHSGGDFNLSTPGHFYWATGILSSFLDNAPTYVVFFEAATVMQHAPDTPLIVLEDGATIATGLLTAISLGAVFMGANTYIGNGPNFMVRSIAEESGVRMPSFFGYMLWSLGVLVPLLIAVHVLFI